MLEGILPMRGSLMRMRRSCLALSRAAANDSRGVTAIEYALIASLISMLIIAAVVSMGQTLSGWFGIVATNL